MTETIETTKPFKNKKIRVPAKKHLVFEKDDVQLATELCKREQLNFMDLMRMLLREYLDKNSTDQAEDLTNREVIDAIGKHLRRIDKRVSTLSDAHKKATLEATSE